MNQNQLKEALESIHIKDEAQKRLIAKCKKREENTMKRIRKPLIATAAAIMLISISFTVYGQEMFNVIRNIFLGNHAQYIVAEHRDSYPVPEQLRGQLFDAEGNEITLFTKANTVVYNSQGDEARIYHDGYGNFSVLTVEEYNNISKQQIEQVEFYDFAEGTKFFICDILNPVYLPDGYSFQRVEFYAASKDELCVADSKYMNICYSNGTDEILCMLRYMDEETAFVSVTEGDANEYREIKINGYDAVIYKGKMLDIQIEDVMYSYLSYENVSAEELIKIAESLE